MPVHYVTNEQGQRTGVLLDIAAYQQLIERQSTDSDLLMEMSLAELEALSANRLALASQSRLDELLALQETGMLGEDGTAELDELLAQVDQLTLLKTRALYTLAQTETAL